MPFKAHNDNVLVKEIKETKVSGGIVIPNSSKEFTKGKVVYIQEGKEVVVGTIVVYKKDDSNDITIDGEDLKLLKMKDIVVSD